MRGSCLLFTSWVGCRSSLMVGTCFQPCLNGVFSQIMFWEKYFGFYFPESPELGEQSLLSLLLKGGSKKMTKKDPHLTLVFLVLSTVEPPHSHWGGFTTTITASSRERLWRSWKRRLGWKERELERKAGEKRKKVRVRNKTFWGIKSR